MVIKTRWPQNALSGYPSLRRMKPKWIALFLINLLFTLLGWICFDQPIITVILLAWGDLVFYCINRLEQRAVLLAFLLTFFTFLIGREALCDFGVFPPDWEHGEVIGLSGVNLFTQAVNEHAEWLLLICLLFLGASYSYFGGRRKIERESK